MGVRANVGMWEWGFGGLGVCGGMWGMEWVWAMGEWQWRLVRPNVDQLIFGLLNLFQ